MKQLVPDDFVVPETFEIGKFKFGQLGIKDLDEDYEAIMSSLPRIKGVFGNEWPSDDLTKEQDLVDLGWHQKEFERRRSFTYLVRGINDNRYMGCVYIYPSDKSQFDVILFSWVKESHKDLDKELFETFKKWVEENWPFEKIACPGREINWDDWDKLN